MADKADGTGRKDTDLQRRYDELTKTDNSTFWGGFGIVFGLAIIWDQFSNGGRHAVETITAIAIVAIIAGAFAFFEKRRKDNLATEIYLKMHGRKDSPKAEPAPQSSTVAWSGNQPVKAPPEPPGVKPGAASLSDSRIVALFVLTILTYWFFGFNFSRLFPGLAIIALYYGLGWLLRAGLRRKGYNIGIPASVFAVWLTFFAFFKILEFYLIHSR